MRPTCLASAALTVLVLLTSCREAEVTRYRVPKEIPPAPPPATADADRAMAATPVVTAEGDGLVWTAPGHWSVNPPASMRRGSYAIRGPQGEADMAITAFPGDVGGELANINRWRGQLGLPALGAADLPAVRTTVRTDNFEFVLVEFDNPAATPPTRMLGAFAAHEGNTWFFKLTGPDALVAAEKPAFVSFLHTVREP